MLASKGWLHWANHDQYYVKSSEYFRDYVFTMPSGKRVRVHLVGASTEQDNKKEAPGKERRFMICAEDPIYEENGELFIRFQYGPAEGKKKQDVLNKEAIEQILGADGYDEWVRELSKPAPTKANPKRTVLEKHLTQYTARNTFDYFIHKDLGGFLRRELDFYIKNEVMHLDDIEHETAPRVEQYLSKIKVIRKIAHKIIQFLEQLENFQKKLWLKKKFVVETNYCITLDRVPEELYSEIVSNAPQREEWVRLIGIDALEQGLADMPYSEPLTVEFLSSHPTLTIDTRHFPRDFVNRLLSKFDNLDEHTDAVLFHSENFQALSAMQRKYRAAIECICIDPPYNTGGDDFIYKDSYRHSSWLSMMYDRLALSANMLSPTGNIFVTVDDNEQAHLRAIMDRAYSPEYFLANAIWEKAYSPRMDAKEFSSDVDHVMVYGAGVSRVQFEQNQRQFNLLDAETGRHYRRRSWRKEGSGSRRADRPNLFYPIEAPDGTKVFPVRPDGSDGRWRGDIKRYEKLRSDRLIEWVESQNGWQVYVKQVFDDQASRPPSTLWTHDVAGHNHEAAEVLKALFAENVFLNPKPPKLASFMHKVCGSEAGGVSLDFFAGSGTVGHAVISLNREDGLRRKFVLVEMGNHFQHVLLPRVKKVVFSPEWRDGTPKRLPTAREVERSPKIIKYVRLESFEDTLRNLELRRSDRQNSLIDHNQDIREQYMLSYILDMEIRGSQSLLNVESFRRPDEYKLKVERNGEAQLVNVDLVETFNWLLGLTVKHIDVIRGVRVVEGTSPDGDRVLVLWRNLDETDNDALDKWLLSQKYNPRDYEFDLIYVNGDNNLENLRRGDQTWKVRLIEEEFGRLMFDVEDV